MGQLQTRIAAVVGGTSPQRRRGKARMKTKPKGGKGPSVTAGKGKGAGRGGVDLTPYDHERQCPAYARLLDLEPEEDALRLDQLDPLQGELENLLLLNAERQRQLARQLHKVSRGEHMWAGAVEAEEEAARRSSEPPPTQPASKVKVKLPSLNGDRLCKTQALAQMASGESGGEDVNPTPGYEPVPLTDRRGRKRVYFWPQNHMPDKFWAFVADYARSPSDEDIKNLKDLIKDNTEEKNRKYFVINTDVWTKSRHSNGNGSASPARRGTKRKLESPEMSEGSDSEKKHKPSERKSRRLSSATGTGTGNGVGSNGGGPSEPHSLGPLTERLVQALLEDSDGLCPPANGDDFAQLNIPTVNGLGGSPNKALVRSLNLGNMAALERRIRKELEDQGLLDPDHNDDDEETEETDTDEVSRELEQRERELRGVMETNRLRLTALLRHFEAGREEARLRPRLEDANRHISELYARFYSTIPKRKPSGKKEREQLRDALQTRRDLLEELDEMKEEA